MNFEAIIGLEIHVEMKTKSKMFSSSYNLFDSKPNHNLTYLDLAFPGCLPRVNKQAVINAIRVSNVLNMKIDRSLLFERKNYFYADLPKGYQITQQFRPIGSEGYIEIETENGIKRINIERLHMEEDTAKQLHFSNRSLLDFNRAGVPLVEIVSKPEIKNGEEARKYVEAIRDIVVYTNVSDGKMEEGSLRCDVNVSIRPVGVKELGTKVEIKNLNSIANIERAIDFDIKRQAKILLSGGTIQQETRRFDELKKETVLMRVKNDSVDYKYFTDSNIAPINLSEEFIEDAINSCPELLSSKKERFINEFGLSKVEADFILSNKEQAFYFEEICKFSKYYKLNFIWISVELQTILNKEQVNIQDVNITPSDIAKIVNAISENKITTKQGREFLSSLYYKNDDLDLLLKEASNNIVSDESSLMSLIKEVIDNNPQSIEDYNNGKSRALGFLVGQVMKLSKGKANPSIVSKLILELLNK